MYLPQSFFSILSHFVFPFFPFGSFFPSMIVFISIFGKAISERMNPMEQQSKKQIPQVESRLRHHILEMPKATPHNGSCGLRRIFCPNRAV